MSTDNKQLTHLLDLKQKHANAFEARFARDQAALTAHQGQTILVFTIGNIQLSRPTARKSNEYLVTIIFLPMSFIAAFFAINIEEFPRSSPNAQTLPLNYVAKYMFGIGLGISVPLIVIALTVDDVGYFTRRVKAAFARLFFRSGVDDEAEKERVALEAKVKDMLDAPRVSNIEKIGRPGSAFGNGGVDGWVPPRKSIGFERVDGADELSPPRRVNSRTTQISWARGRRSEDIERGRALV
jgi:hypothetical protein